MKKILVAGYGNIGKALQRVSEYHQTGYEFEFIDELLNCPVEDYLRMEKYDKSADILVNLTGSTSKEIMTLCDERGINYIDAGIEVDAEAGEVDVPGAFEDFRNTRLNTRALIGAGMNPGLIEVIYRKYRPDYIHAALELEVDSAKHTNPDTVFNTWSPLSLYSEFCLDKTFYYNKNIILLDRTAKEIPFITNAGPRQIRFHLVPHEEIISMAESSRKCILSAFLYSPANVISDCFYDFPDREIKQMIKGIPVVNDLQGEDCVGMLLCRLEKTDTISHYYFNSADHRDCYRKYGINGTSWQVACGILAAIYIIGALPEKKVYTMTEAAEENYDEILDFLKSLNFFVREKEVKTDEMFIKRLQETGRNHVLF